MSFLGKKRELKRGLFEIEYVEKKFAPYENLLLNEYLEAKKNYLTKKEPINYYNSRLTDILEIYHWKFTNPAKIDPKLISLSQTIQLIQNLIRIHNYCYKNLVKINFDIVKNI